MRPLDLHALSWNDFVANGVFFIIDIILLSIFVPFLVRRYENRKWSPARLKVAECSARYVDSIDFHFESLAKDIEGFFNALPDAFENQEDMYTADGIRTQRAPLFKKFEHDVSDLENTLSKSTSKYLQAIGLLRPSFDSTLAIQTMEFYESATRPSSMAMATFYLWMLRHGSEEKEPPDIGVVSSQLLPLYMECEGHLECLCQSTGLPAKKVNERLLIINRKVPQTDGRSKVYPNHATMSASLQKLLEVLTSPLVPKEGGLSRTEQP